MQKRMMWIFSGSIAALVVMGLLLGRTPGGEAALNPGTPFGMSAIQAAVLGMVEGITEYLPVSSTGHLILTQQALGIADGEAIKAYEICIQAGAIVAVLGIYWRRVEQMMRGVTGRDEEGRRLAVCVVAGFLPAMVIGLGAGKWIKAHLFGLWPVVIAWFVGGVAILAVAWWRKRTRGADPKIGLGLGGLTWKMALWIGVAQCLAMWPGTSRSLVTIVGGVVAGLSLPAAVEFSFLLGVVTLCAATAHDALKYGDEIVKNFGVLAPVVGFAMAGLFAFVAVKWMVEYLNKHGMQVFGYYRVALAVVVAVMILAS